MKLSSGFGLLIGSLVVAALAFCLLEPVPDYVQDRWLLIGHSLQLKLCIALGNVLEFFHLGSFETLTHKASNLVFRAPGNTSTVTFTYRMFASSKTLVVTPAAKAMGDASKGSAAVIYIHGGGWALGAPEMYASVFAELVEKTGVTLFSVRYRLAPEHKFPAAFEDCLAATEAIFANAADLGIDPSRIAIAGDSAGGQLTASVVQELHRSGSQFKPKLQMLIYPVTQIVNFHTESHRNHRDAPIMGILRIRNFVSQHLTGSRNPGRWLHEHGHVTPAVKATYEKLTGDVIPPVAKEASAPLGNDQLVDNSVAARVIALATDFRVSPLLGNELEKLGLPSAHILACEYDPLFHDSIMYAERLEQSGVRVHLKRFSTYHGVLVMPNDGRQMREYLVHVYKDLL